VKMSDAWGGGDRKNLSAENINLSRGDRDALEADFINEWITWDRLKGWTHGFYHEEIRVECLNAINTEIKHKIQPKDSGFYGMFKDICRNEISLKYSMTAVNASAAGFMAAPRESKGNAIWEMADDRLIQGLRPADMTALIGLPGVGKSDLWEHYIALQTLNKGRYVASMIGIENNSVYTNYRYGGNNSDLMLRACDIIIPIIDKQEADNVAQCRIKVPMVKMCRDDIAAGGVDRARATSDDTYQVQALGYIMRKAGVQLDTLWQFEQSIPTSIRRAISRKYTLTIKDGHRFLLMQYLQNDKAVRTIPIFGFIGLQQRLDSDTKPCRDGIIRPLPHLDYNTNQMRVAENDFDISGLLGNFTRLERLKGRALTMGETWREGIRDYLLALQKLPSDDKPLTATPQSAADFAATLMLEAKYTRDLGVLALTVDAIENVMAKYGATRGRIEPRLRKLIARKESNPEEFDGTVLKPKEICANIDRILHPPKEPKED
jgi:hypothetical protein